ncbi:MAG: FAD-binding protein, partial [Rikenellaceae bacterium]
MLINIVTTPEIAASEERYTALVAETINISKEQIAALRIKKKSIDARSRDIKVNLSIEVFVNGESPEVQKDIEYGDVSSGQPIIIVGCGPAGLSAALRAIELGYKPIIFERGKEVSERKKDIAAINQNKPIDPDSNYAFGEGGAGTYSDGKLFTRSKKRGDHAKALTILHQHGASENILYETHAHIGSD